MKNPITASKRSDLVSYPIRDIVVEAKKLEKEGTKMIYLNIGDPATFGFRPPQHILDAVKEALDTPKYSAYAPSEGDPELRQEIARIEKAVPENVFVMNGLSEGIDFVFQAMMDAGDTLLLPSPTYPLYLTKERIGFGTETFYECDDSSWEPNLDSMRKAITPKTKAISVISPNNPTGAVYSRKTLQGIVDIAGEHGLPILADDAYEEVVFDGEKVNFRDLHKDVPLISGSSISKNYLYPGARVGWLTFHGEGLDLVKNAMQRLCNQRLSVNWEMQRGALAALKKGPGHMAAFNQTIKGRRDLLKKRIDGIDGLSLSVPNGAFYAFVKIEDMKGHKNDWGFVRALLKEGVVTVPGSAFTTVLPPTYFRIVLLPPEETIDLAFNKIEAYMKK
ncbi:MAG: aminotransferase class I/II-fold pyridoxal phosphate-dependent enzyme [Candidatus Micrarchaeia archaeon]|jgi:aspartate/methionine/tyrosine aminotransferase